MALLHGNKGYRFIGFVKSVFFFAKMCWLLYSAAVELRHHDRGNKEELNVSE